MCVRGFGCGCVCVCQCGGGGGEGHKSQVHVLEWQSQCGASESDGRLTGAVLICSAADLFFSRLFIHLIHFLSIFSVQLQLLHGQRRSQVPVLPAAAEGRERQGQRVCGNWLWCFFLFLSSLLFLFKARSHHINHWACGPFRRSDPETPVSHTFHQAPHSSPLFAALG